ncbi:hypothetical protein [Pedobacter sp. B4-66]|uniref:hypothetical protein n=1 Tax=Pedobacter sp. B4-66 TaxID=2817280 RepID=UPI001BDAD08A|nr:hypothetical protein [Pedobacter sp. B4-66]
MQNYNKTKLASVLLLLLSFQLSFAQQESKVVIKEVLFVRHFLGDFKLPKPTGTTLSLVGELDSYRFMIVPYNKKPGGGHWAFENYLFEFWQNPFIYHYNEIFLSNMTFKQDYVDMIKNSSKKSKYTDLVSSLPNDQTYLIQKSQGILANVWLIEAEWEQFTVKDKPEFIKGLTPNILIFDHYDLFILRKVLKATSVDRSLNEIDASSVEFRKDIAPHPFPIPH